MRLSFQSVDVADLPDITAIMGELQQPYDDIPDYDGQESPEINTSLRLTDDKAHLRTPTRRLMVDYRANPDAYRHIEPLPAEGESLHGVISGKYALFELIPALIEKTGQAMEELYLATLGFSKQNGADLCGLIDDGHVKSCTLIPSHYFKSTSESIYDAVVPELLKRGQRVFAIRNHAKLILAHMADGTSYVCESSANLRSCVNIETFVLTRCPQLYDFHRGWIEGEVAAVMERKVDGELHAPRAA
jgi:hypothetical protein